jgi:hypothetical protein
VLKKVASDEITEWKAWDKEAAKSDPEHESAENMYIKCKLCDWEIPKDYRDHRGRPYDSKRIIYKHLKEQHPEEHKRLKYLRANDRRDGSDLSVI